MSGSVVKRALAFGLTTLLVSSAATLPARAENAMGYRLLSEQEAATLPARVASANQTAKNQ
jgi:hypothetical protein